MDGCMHACMHAWMHACMHARMHACMHARMHACMYGLTHGIPSPSLSCGKPRFLLHVCMHVCMYVCVHIYACVCIYVYVHKRTKASDMKTSSVVACAPDSACRAGCENIYIYIYIYVIVYLILVTTRGTSKYSPVGPHCSFIARAAKMAAPRRRRRHMHA